MVGLIKILDYGMYSCNSKADYDDDPLFDPRKADIIYYDGDENGISLVTVRKDFGCKYFKAKV